MKTIPCTVGILTYNSERNLSRALASITDFAEVIIADGGSTDATLAIARASNTMSFAHYDFSKTNLRFCAPFSA